MRFLQQAGLGHAAPWPRSAAHARCARADSPREAVVLGVIGVNGRGTALAAGFAAVGGARVAYVCDVDERVIDKAASAVGEQAEPTRPSG